MDQLMQILVDSFQIQLTSSHRTIEMSVTQLSHAFIFIPLTIHDNRSEILVSRLDDEVWMLFEFTDGMSLCFGDVAAMVLRMIICMFTTMLMLRVSGCLLVLLLW